MTIADALQEGIALCCASETAKLDAQLLLCEVLNVERTYLYTWPEKTLNEAQLSQYRSLLQQRAQGKPIAHLLGYRDFWTFRLAVDNSTLIPRPETEIIVELCLSLPMPEQVKVLELGTGTGAIALALASEQPQWCIDAVDLQQQAVQLAKRNRDALKLSQVNIFQSNWFSAVSSNQYQLIVSNPPYIDEQDPHLNQGDLRFEPRSALIADDQGLADIKFIMQHAKEFLQPGGWLVFEHGFTQAEDIRKYFLENGYDEIATRQDYAGLDRVTYAQCNRKYSEKVSRNSDQTNK
ncbi:MAG TPA: peptide chain release factor N(5)-glutamine methyltransferase [Aliidiomarina sp.]|nr:peptide chain release factor N(5)-glutamine methyltransferase [Aliidiomarina sp.]